MCLFFYFNELKKSIRSIEIFIEGIKQYANEIISAQKNATPTRTVKQILIIVIFWFSFFLRAFEDNIHDPMKNGGNERTVPTAKQRM